MDFKIESSFKLVAAKNYPTQREGGRIEGGVGGMEGEGGREGGWVGERKGREQL